MWKRLAPRGEAFHFSRQDVPLRPDSRHGHDFVEFFWVSAGRGVEHLLDEARPLAAGDYALVAAADRHALASSGGMMLSNLAFPSSAWAALSGRYRPALPDYFGGSSASRRGRLTLDQVQQLDAAVRGLPTGPRDARTLDRVLLTLDDVLQQEPAARVAPAWLQQALAEPDRWRSEGVAGLVKVCGYSREHVARCCRDYLGRSPTQCVNEARLVHAAELLTRGQRSVTEVGYDAGFGNLGHFHQRFKQRFGLTPRQFKARQAAAVPS